MTVKRMRVVGVDEVPERKRKPMSLIDAVEGGDYLQILLAQRRDIVSSLPGEKGPARAALHRQLALISKEVDALELATDGSPVVAGTPDAAFDSTEI